MIGRIVIVGAGSTGRTLVARLVAVAPITVIDSSPAALAELEASPPAAAGEGKIAGSPPAVMTSVLADGTSRLVLADQRDPRVGSATALVAATGSDRHNLEVCRLGESLGFGPIVAIVIDAGFQSEYRDTSARAIVRGNVLGDLVEQTLRSDGITIATNVGFGRGDVIEIRVLASSPAAGRRPADLESPDWRIAAIYRGEELLLPTEETRIQEHDRLLLIGNPEILSHVGENLRMGQPDFPLRYGANIVVYLPRGRDRALEGPAEVLALRTRGRRLLRLHPGAEPSSVEVPTAESPNDSIRTELKRFEDQPLPGATLGEHMREILDTYDPGVIVAHAGPRTLLDRITGRSGRAGALCDLTSVPVLFPAGSPHVTRVVLAAGVADSNLRAADAAVDLARMLGLPLTVVHVELPAYLGGDHQDQLLANIQQRAGLYRLASTIVTRDGNPILETVGFLEATDLCVVPRRRSGKDSFTAPDMALRIVRSGRCSTLVISVNA